jgi:hypothetical protein
LEDEKEQLANFKQFNTLFSHTGFAVNLTSVFLSIAQIMSGVMSINMPAFLRAFNYLSPLRYATRNLAPYSLANILFTCSDSQRLPDGQCPITTGKEVLQLYNLDTDPGLNLAMLGLITVLYRVLAYALLKVVRGHWSWGKGKGWREKLQPTPNPLLPLPLDPVPLEAPALEPLPLSNLEAGVTKE